MRTISHDGIPLKNSRETKCKFFICAHFPSETPHSNRWLLLAFKVADEADSPNTETKGRPQPISAFQVHRRLTIVFDMGEILNTFVTRFRSHSAANFVRQTEEKIGLLKSNLRWNVHIKKSYTKDECWFRMFALCSWENLFSMVVWCTLHGNNATVPTARSTAPFVITHSSF